MKAIFVLKGWWRTSSNGQCIHHA
ncbi:TPA: trp operon leader peptide [Escherichia coli]|nr:trp operon leader peptide [Escherichia coli]EGE3743712.1 trp operon leader peptide [Shigella boydii]EKD7758376.1 trp operon leader peptide [Shigella sonnei]RIH42234.1 trp operon leader peptide [Shigella dysenteriae]EED0594094.1 trp operon leader peptide [Escherichia coli]